MENVFKGLKPEALWRYFYEINQIPRESKHEAEVAEWLKGLGKKFNLPVKEDKTGNVIITKPGSPGNENAPTVCMQGHMDMVCEMNKGTEHDFRKDPIKMFIDGDFVKAEGTTLGADNGIGIAAALAIMESTDIEHPPMEFLFTVDEETGLTGATELEEGFSKANILLNCDSEEDGALYVGCAGGKDTQIYLDIDWENAPPTQKAITLRISGMKGGHSGLDIHKGRANGIKELNRVLWNAPEEIDFRLYEISGGTKHNAIPREAECKLIVPAEKFEDLKSYIADYEKIIQNEFKDAEKGIILEVEENSNYPEKVFPADLQARLMNMIYAIPHGVAAMNLSIPGLVETSTSLAIIETKDQIFVLTSQRSSIESAKLGIANQVKAAGLLANADVRQGGDYPGWNPNMDSAILKVMKDVYNDLFGKVPEVKAIHAGLECGLIGEKVPGLDMISFGPTINNPHSPDEEVSISTIKKFWKVVVETLNRIAKS